MRHAKFILRAIAFPFVLLAVVLLNGRNTRAVLEALEMTHE